MNFLNNYTTIFSASFLTIFNLTFSTAHSEWAVAVYLCLCYFKDFQIF